MLILGGEGRGEGVGYEGCGVWCEMFLSGGVPKKRVLFQAGMSGAMSSVSWLEFSRRGFGGWYVCYLML